MHRLRFDITPAIINRTAVYHIIRDTVRALAKTNDLKLSVLGYDVSFDTIEKPDPVTVRNVGKFLQGDGDDSLPSAPQTENDVPTIYFDPLYSLAARQLRKIDCVLILDLTTLTNPEWHQPHIGRLYQKAFGKVTTSPAKLLAISHHTRCSLAANFAIRCDEIPVIPLYPLQALQEVQAVSVPELQGKKLLLFVGSLETRKNVGGLIAAFEASGLAEKGFHLVIAGGDGKGAELVKERSEGVAGVHLQGFVSTPHLKWLYQNALWFVYPSFLEGFGVPILEAMEAGLPVACAITGALPEVVGDAARFMNPYNVFEMSRALRSLGEIGEDERRLLAIRSRERAKHFSIDRYLTEFQAAVFADLTPFGQ